MTLLFHRINTLQRLSQVRGSATAVELDVTLVDGKLAVVHNKDYQMDLAKMEAMTWDQLQKLDPNIPLLDAYVTQAAQAGIALYIEAKGSTTAIASQVAEGIVQTIAIAVQQMRICNTSHTLEPAIILHGFSIEALQHGQHVAQTLGLSIQIGLGWTSSIDRANELAATQSTITRVQKISGRSLEQIANLTPLQWAWEGLHICNQYGFEMLAVHKNSITEELVKTAHTEQILVDAFVVTTSEEQQQMETLGVDIATCDPALFGVSTQ